MKKLCLQRPERQVYVLFLGIGEHFLEAFLAADAGLLVAAERRAEEMLGDFVDPDKARLHGGGGAVRGRKIIGPDRSSQPVFDRIHLFEHFAFVAPFEDRKHVAENFLARDAHIRLHVCEHGRLDEKAVGQRRIGGTAAAGEKPRAFLLGGVDESRMRSYCDFEMIAPMVVERSVATPGLKCAILVFTLASTAS